MVDQQETWLWLVLSSLCETDRVLVERSGDNMPLFCSARLVNWERATSFVVLS